MTLTEAADVDFADCLPKVVLSTVSASVAAVDGGMVAVEETSDRVLLAAIVVGLVVCVFPETSRLLLPNPSWLVYVDVARCISEYAVAYPRGKVRAAFRISFIESATYNLHLWLVLDAARIALAYRTNMQTFRTRANALREQITQDP
jgi:hypothetical protein